MEMEQTLTDTIHQVNETKGYSHQNISTEGEDFYLMIPIMDEEQLSIFEDKLLEKSYKLCVVCENFTLDLTVITHNTIHLYRLMSSNVFKKKNLILRYEAY